MRQLRSDVDTSVASRRNRSLPVQRMRTLPQDERAESTPHQTKTTSGMYVTSAYFNSSSVRPVRVKVTTVKDCNRLTAEFT